MIIENPAALPFILNEQIYLSKSDIGRVDAPSPVTAIPDEPVVAEIPVAKAVGEIPVPVPAKPANEAPLVTEPVTQPTVVNFNYSGKNAKGFLIVCHYPELEGMDEKHLAALISTLQRKELTLDDVAIINLAQHANATAKQIHAFFKPARLLILGQQGILPGWDTLVFNQLLEKNGFKALLTDSFSDMLADREKARAFWEQMKQL
ncbi:hypothetical protein BEL04_12890 [Mucilaginibacter sp. PPCGB 2223]|uniref:hypothetical protein n=1 Tax=Mucilaginibacter sp. PPCGB 2223 TaxID=1886027 RepID=UPI00082616ED|nr:hypothetical protein [Mucilaginibacter sp. PPCGB 2223]OCX52361.1 hypothetical protein BEL04_12890 [Mucilaginibacter sp. PPCGB 2223]